MVTGQLQVANTSVVASRRSTPNAGLTVNTNVSYEFGAGALKGLSVGDTGQWQRDIRKGYATIGGARQLYFQPNFTRFDLRLGYRLKVRKTNWNFQLTAQNLFEVQPVETTLADGGGLTLVNISQAPRTFILSTRLKF